MNTIISRAVAIVGFSVLAMGGGVEAQTAPSPILSSVEVRTLIESSKPADHARLSAHFAALADQYAADVKRHTSMQQAYAGNSKLAGVAVSMAAHCKRLADLDRESAATLKELSTHHTTLAGGAVSEKPRGAERFEAAAGARTPTDAELTRLAASAETAADHRVLEEYFTSLAARYDREAADHAAYARSWRGMTKVPSAPTTAAHCDRVANQRREAAKEARAAAAMHKEHGATAR